MGKMQREKGKRYERLIANEFRKRWPGAIVRRASQAERAHNSDVFIEGGPPLLSRLWLELNDARQPQPLRKLDQAIGDAQHRWAVMFGAAKKYDALPVVIWHRLGERTSHATMHLWVLDEIRYCMSLTGRHHDSDEAVVTMLLDGFLDLLEEFHPNRCTCTYEVGSGGPVCTCWFGQRKEAA